MIVTSICSSYREAGGATPISSGVLTRGQGRRKDIDLFRYLCDAIGGCTPRGSAWASRWNAKLVTQTSRRTRGASGIPLTTRCSSGRRRTQ
jgi:hypothetical protein